MFTEILGGAVIGLILPVFQEVIVRILSTSPQSEMAGPTLSILWLSVHLLPLVPVVSTLVGFVAAKGAAGNAGLVGYAAGVLGGAALFSAPEFAMSLFIAGFIVYTFGYLLNSESGGRGGYGTYR